MKQSSINITASEAYTLGKHNTQFVSTYKFICEFMKLRNNPCTALIHNWEAMIFIADVFNAGRISGIREERNRKNKANFNSNNSMTR